MDDETVSLSLIIVLYKKKVFYILWLPLILLGIVKQAQWILFSILLIHAYSRDRIINCIFETGYVSFRPVLVHLIQLLLNLSYLILLCLCYLYMEDRVIWDSCILFLTSLQTMKSIALTQNFLFIVISTAVRSLSLCVMLGITDSSRSHSGLALCNFYSNENHHWKLDQRLHKATCRNNVLCWEVH